MSTFSWGRWADRWVRNDRGVLMYVGPCQTDGSQVVYLLAGLAKKFVGRFLVGSGDITTAEHAAPLAGEWWKGNLVPFNFGVGEDLVGGLHEPAFPIPAALRETLKLVDEPFFAWDVVIPGATTITHVNGKPVGDPVVLSYSEFNRRFQNAVMIATREMKERYGCDYGTSFEGRLYLRRGKVKRRVWTMAKGLHEVWE
jgi:hypothetical protein